MKTPIRSTSLTLVHRLLVIATFIAVLAATGPVVADQPDDPLAVPNAVDTRIPTPESVLGYPLGDHAARYDAIFAYVEALAKASPLVTVTTYAHSHEGRPLRYLTITSRKNHQRLDEIKSRNAQLADPRRLDGDRPIDELIDDMPAIAWLAYSIHGDELSPSDAALQVMYLLAAGTDDRTRRMREQLVVIVDPLQNPDGRERYLAQLQTLQGKVANPDYQAMQHRGLWSAGRGNHYLFDLNRDWLMQVHPETRGRTAAILEWNPHFLVDSHEMSGLDTYLFDPPREPINTHLAEPLMKWRSRFSADQASAFDRFGWSYYTREWYEEWYPGYTNAWANLLGTIGLLYEAPSLNGAIVRQESGELTAYAHAVRANVVSTMANLSTLLANRRAILRDYHEDRRWAVSGRGPYDEVFLLPPADDRTRRARLMEMLDRHGIEHRTADAPVQARQVRDTFGRQHDRVTYPAGTVIVAPSQPHRRLMYAILGFDPRMTDAFLVEERTDLERGRGSRLYDITAWNLPMAYGLDAAWAASVETGAAASEAGDEPNAVDDDPEASGVYGYLIDGATDDVLQALPRLFDSGCVVRLATEPFAVDGHAYDRGSLLLRRHENEGDLQTRVRAAVEGLDVHMRPVDTARTEDGPDLGGRRMALLHPPRVAIASQWPIARTSFGAIWHLLDARLSMRCSPINVQSLGGIDLRTYNVLVLPDAGGLGAVLEGRAGRQLRDWVEAGGTLIACGGAAEALTSEDLGLSSVRERRDVLDQLDVYADAVRRERDARDVSVDPERVWEGGDSTSDDDEPQKKSADVESLRRADAWARRFAPRGVFLAADVDQEHWLCYGLPARLATMAEGRGVLMARDPVETAVRFIDAEQLRMSGLLWPEARERLAHGAYLTRERRGNGQVILFHSDPFLRGYLEGTGRMLQNAILLGPGMGTSQPMPW